jgi:hypothetical protein
MVDNDDLTRIYEKYGLSGKAYIDITDVPNIIRNGCQGRIIDML